MNTKTDETLERHGNPTLILPPLAGPRSVRLRRGGGDGAVVWRAHDVADGVDAVSIDVWHGSFEGDLGGASLLPIGRYEPECADAGGRVQRMPAFDVVERVRFDVDLTTIDAAALADARAQQAHGPWQAGPSGLEAPTGTGHLFRDGAMHGVLSARWSLAGGDAAFGLIARHYNAANHVRLECHAAADAIRLTLVLITGASITEAERTVLAEGRAPRSVEVEVVWDLNGRRHVVEMNGRPVLHAHDGTMGGVTIVGLHTGPGAARARRFRMGSTQHVPVFDVAWPEYTARIRPGNISALMLEHSSAPDQNLCWESGIQFGHIGGSELKFTQGATMHRVAEGPVASVVRWEGPMPKFVEQSEDVRGCARGHAVFYPDRIVLADAVLTWVRRSVGPDFDLLGRLLSGPARLALAGERGFREWDLPAEGRHVPIRTPRSTPTYPVIAGFPFALGDEPWWLLTLIDLRYPTEPLQPTALFAWQDPLGLTASHDFRCAPTTPGVEYAYTILIAWSRDDRPSVERELNRMRDDWQTPARIEPLIGDLVTYEGGREQPREAMDFHGCFDRGTGRHVVSAGDDGVRLRIDPLGIPRRGLGLTIRNWPRGAEPLCQRDERPLAPGVDVRAQAAGPDACWLWLPDTLEQATELTVVAK